MSEKCSICKHPQHKGRCPHPITEEHSEARHGIIFSRIETVGTCVCGLVDSLMQQIGT